MGAEFIAEEGTLKGFVLSLDEGEEWIIGRDPDQCSLVIEDPRASRKHLLCKKTAEGYLIQNLSDANPVSVNDQIMTGPTLLHDKDRVKIGGSVFRFYQEGIPDEISSGAGAGLPVANEWENTIEEERPFEASSELPEVHFDLSQTSRFIIKVIAGPNTGAEFALDVDRSYLIGTDTSSCDIIFNDLSVSREHARLTIAPDGTVTISDLNSRNGVMVDKERIAEQKALVPNSIVTLGTSSFLLIDREAPAETIAAPMFAPPPFEAEKPEEEVEIPEEAAPTVKVEEEVKPVEIVKEAPKPKANLGSLLLSMFLAGLIVLFGIGTVSLFREKEIVPPPKDYSKEIGAVMKDFPDVKYTFNSNTGKLFLVGHVANGIRKNELFYNLQGLTFIKGIEDHVVDDEAIWQEMNILLSKHPDFKGVSMHSPKPGVFALTGYLKTNEQMAALTDYMNLHFNYLDKLENHVVVEESIVEQMTSELAQKGFSGVTAALLNGELILTGYISTKEGENFQTLVGEFEKVQGIRSVRNFVVLVTPEQGVIDLNKRYPGRYNVTGYSKHGDVNINVVINGRIYSRGDVLKDPTLGELTITSIQPHAIFLEREGLKYKIGYNK